MIAADVVAMRAEVLRFAITAHGGAYILPHENTQPDPALRIASIRALGITGIGATEAEAQADWFRQRAQA